MVHKQEGHIESRIAYYLMNIHITPRSIYLTRVCIGKVFYLFINGMDGEFAMNFRYLYVIVYIFFCIVQCTLVNFWTRVILHSFHLMQLPFIIIKVIAKHYKNMNEVPHLVFLHNTINHIPYYTALQLATWSINHITINTSHFMPHIWWYQGITD